MSDTLRLIMPQWQGGNNPPYSFGSKLLAWLVGMAVLLQKSILKKQGTLKQHTSLEKQYGK